MSCKASNIQLKDNFSGSGALSHVYLSFIPLQCRVPGSTRLFYDDGTKLLISATSNQVYTWKTVPFSTCSAPLVDLISEGPVLNIRYSLDMKFMAVQRSSVEIQLWHRDTGESFSHKYATGSGNILGFFWTDCPLCNLVVVKTSGLDLFACYSQSKSLHLVERRKKKVNWYVYTHESRLLLLASGVQCKSFSGFQISSAGIIRLSNFDVMMAKSEVNNKPVLHSEDVYIVTIYGRIYFLQYDRVAMLLHSYRFYRDVVVQQGSLPLYSNTIAVSVVDNVLLVHQVDAKVVILYDIYADSRAPISAPLPLLFRGFPRSNSSFSRSSGRVGERPEVEITSHDGTVYGNSWRFMVPDLICDLHNQLLWKIHLDLEAIAASNSDVSSVLEFLQRRKLDARKAKELCLGLTRTVILERRPVPFVAKAINILVTAYSYSIKTTINHNGVKQEPSEHPVRPTDHEMTAAARTDAADQSSNILSSDSENESHFESLRKNTSGFHSSERRTMFGIESPSNEVKSQSEDGSSSIAGERQGSSPVISLEEIYSYVFAPVEEEMVGDTSYLVGILVELLRSANIEKLKVHPNLYVLTTQLMARNERYTELTLFITYKIIEPSKEVAMQLLESGRQNSQIRKVGLDMLRQLSLHHDYVLLLVQDGRYIEALRYARKHRVVTVRPSLLLEAALASNDTQVLAAVLRFFCDFTPGFRDTMDHQTYYRILTDMNSAIL